MVSVSVVWIITFLVASLSIFMFIVTSFEFNNISQSLGSDTFSCCPKNYNTCLTNVEIELENIGSFYCPRESWASLIVAISTLLFIVNMGMSRPGSAHSKEWTSISGMAAIIALILAGGLCIAFSLA